MTSGSPWFRATDGPEGEPYPQGTPAPAPVPPHGYAPGPVPPAYEAETAVYEAIPGPEAHLGPQPPQTPQGAYEGAYAGSYEPVREVPTYDTPTYDTPTYDTPTYDTPAYDTAAYDPPAYDRPTHGRQAYDTPAHDAPAYEAPTYEAPDYDDAPAPDGPADPRPADEGAAPLPGPGRAERRRAARRKGRAPEPDAAPQQTAAPLSRVEARRAARAAKDSIGVVLSRVVGELFITFGVVMLLFVTYQLWWTNVRAGQQTDRAKAQIENSWQQGESRPDAFEPGQGFAIMYIPKLDVVAPIAEGISKTKVLDKGLVGHYGEGKLKTAMPGDKQGNFAVAGHRNTHGEPFRYINQLKPGDPIVVETQDAYYTYEMASILPQTSPSNVSVIEPVPKGSGFTKPGRYITLTTCTPEFTSTYRMIVWGKLVDERPRSKGKPDALVG
ncbi:class E sortase [Streptomyces showdoensis]|uniref:Peptidase C60 family protein n=1 Tax=Streptomyces showdoensis TaxID=68268 RepID=A0A2P2GME5_STREW|nr:class E sortase [Streptomyces showdoensis]KKZ72672.1 peptidase C60 family protein [Streptomyces showdoensis]